MRDDQRQLVMDSISEAPEFAVKSEELANALVKAAEKENDVYDLCVLIKKASPSKPSLWFM